VQRILVTGATGFVGTALVRSLLSHGHVVSVLSRDVGKARALFGSQVQLLLWAPPERWPSIEELSRQDVIVHLAGEPAVMKRFGEGARRRIRDSRVLTTRKLVELFRQTNPRPSALVCASAIGYYGAQPPELELTEEAPSGTGFLAELCHEWESAARGAELLGMRVVAARMGVVLGEGGGALAAMLGTFRAGFGGRLGSGRQMMSWIHLEDAVAALRWCIERESVCGAVNVVSPSPVDNVTFTKTLGKAVGRPAIVPVPALALRALFGEGAEPFLTGQRVLPHVLAEQGFVWRHPTLQGALSQAVRK
jgi:uncharacterized protein